MKIVPSSDIMVCGIPNWKIMFSLISKIYLNNGSAFNTNKDVPKNNKKKYKIVHILNQLTNNNNNKNYDDDLIICSKVL